MTHFTHSVLAMRGKLEAQQLRQQAKRKVRTVMHAGKGGEERGAKRKEGAALESYALPPELTPLVLLVKRDDTRFEE